MGPAEEYKLKIMEALDGDVSFVRLEELKEVLEDVRDELDSRIAAAIDTLEDENPDDPENGFRDGDRCEDET